MTESTYQHNGEDKLQSRPKVLFIMHMPPPVHGAAMVGKWIQESELINSKFDCYYQNLAFANDATDIGKFSLLKVWRLIKLIRKVKALVKTIKPDLVYITPNSCGMPFIKDSFVVNAVKSTGCRVLAHFHNKGVSRYESNPIFGLRYRKFFKGLKVLLIVPSLYDDMKTFVSEQDVYFCPNGSPTTLKEEVKAERHHEVPEILFLSNMIISKGVLDLLDALCLLREQGYKFHCTLVGAETAELSGNAIKEEIDSRSLTDRVEFVGPQYGENKNECLQNADIMSFPTYNDVFGLVLLEAMEYKIPVVATKEGGIPSVVLDGETGLLCEKQNPKDLSEKLAKLIDNPELRWKMGEAGYKLRMEKYTLEAFEKNLASVLERNIK